MPNSKPSSTVRSITSALRGLYPLGAYLILIPLLDVSTRAIPFASQNVAWRFGMAGLVFANVGTVLIGLSIVGLIAAAVGDVKVLKVMAVTTLVGGVLLLGISLLYVLDTFQLMAAADGPRQVLVRNAAILSEAAALLGVCGLVGAGVGAWFTSRALDRKRSRLAQSQETGVPLYKQSVEGWSSEAHR